MLPSAEQDQLGLIGVQFQSVRCHPRSTGLDVRHIGFQSAIVFNSRSPCWCTTSCLRTRRKTANLCLLLDTDDCVRWTPTRAYSAANQHTFWQSLIRCCWTSSMEQSANPAARVRYYTRTISTSTQNAYIWSLTAAAPSDSVFRARV